LKWVAAHTLPVSRFEDVAMLRNALDALALNRDGKQAAAKTVTRKRAILFNALEWKALGANNLHCGEVDGSQDRAVIDKRVVINAPG
jgi:hypothetical protein